MKYRLSTRAEKDYRVLDTHIRASVDKQFGFLLENLRHPSLRAKKYDERKDIWQGRVDRNYRFYIQIQGDTYYIISIVPHPK